MSRNISNIISEVDDSITSKIQQLVPLKYDTDKAVFMNYMNDTEPSIWKKMEAAQTLTGEPAKPVVNITEEDLHWQDEKKNLKKKQLFNQWVIETYKPYENPVNQKALEEIYPEFFSEQEKSYNDWLEMHKKVENIRIRGPQNIKDLYLMVSLGFVKEAPVELQNAEAIAYYKEPNYATGVIAGPYRGDKADTKFNKGMWPFNKEKQQARDLYSDKGVFSFLGNSGAYNTKMQAVTGPQSYAGLISKEGVPTFMPK